MTCFTSLSSTTLIRIEDNGEEIVLVEVGLVVGWQHTTGNYATPILAYPCENPNQKGYAIEHPDGQVTDYSAKKIFEDRDAWFDYIFAEVQKAAGGDAKQPEEPKKNNPKGKPEVEVIFGSKTYKTKSYWFHPDTGILFEIEPGEPYPEDPAVNKIKREEQSELRRAGAQYGIAVPFKVPEEEHPIHETSQQTEDEDDDDLGGLV